VQPTGMYRHSLRSGLLSACLLLRLRHVTMKGRGSRVSAKSVMKAAAGEVLAAGRQSVRQACARRLPVWQIEVCKSVVGGGGGGGVRGVVWMILSPPW